MKQFKNGVHDISNEDYHSSTGVSRSALWLFKQSPKHYWHKYLNPDRTPDKPNPNFLIGELVHCLVLEPDQFKKRYYVMEKVNKATKVGKAAYADALIDAGDREIVSTTDCAVALKMSDSALESDTASSLFGMSKNEQSIYFTHEATGLQVKVRPDAWMGSIVTDLKTVKSAYYRDFQSSAYKYGYFLQAAMIKLGLESVGIEMEKFIFYCVEKNEPYLPAYYILDDDALTFGVNQFHDLMNRFALCVEENEWSGYEPQILYTPNYADKD